MVRLGRCLLGLALALLVVSPVLAQDPPGGGGRGRGPQGGRGGGMNPFALLNDKGIREELKLSEEQIKKIDEFMRNQRPPQFTPGGDPQEMRAQFEEFRKNQEKEMGNILNADQMKRFKQLRLQSIQKNQGLGALLMNPEVGQALDFNDDQRESFREIMEESRRAMQEMRENRVPPQEMMAKMQELQKANSEKIEKMLTAGRYFHLIEALAFPVIPDFFFNFFR
jgi:Spy/CpxP family protein refolding chaperone